MRPPALAPTHAHADRSTEGRGGKWANSEEIEGNGEAWAEWGGERVTGAQTLRAFSLLELRKDKFEVEILAFQVRVQLDNLLLSDRQQCFDHLLQLRYAVTLFPRLGNEE
jgi:hypothetical protein